MNRLNSIERDGTAPVDPVSGGGRLVIKGIVWFTANGADERKRGLVPASGCILKVNLRGRRVLGNHAAEKICRDPTHKCCRCAETRDAYSDIEARTSRHRHVGVPPIQRFDGQEIDQCISATQQHRFQFFASIAAVTPIRCIASRLSRSSFLISPWTCRFVRWKSAIPVAVRSLNRPIADMAAMASAIDPRDFAATAPSMAAPRRTGYCVYGTATVKPAVSAMLWRPGRLRYTRPMIP